MALQPDTESVKGPVVLTPGIIARDRRPRHQRAILGTQLHY